MEIQVARVSGNFHINLTLTLKEIIPKWSKKPTAVFVDCRGNETRMTVGDVLNLSIPVKTHEITKGDQTVQKLKDVIKELSE